jgi:hypothetical protein
MLDNNCCVFKNGMNFKLNQNMEHCMNMYSNTSTMQWRSRWSVFSMHMIVWGYCVLVTRILVCKPRFCKCNDTMYVTVKFMGLFGGIWNENAVNLYELMWISWILCLVMKQHMVSPIWIVFVFLVWSFHLEIECHIWDAFYQSRWEWIAHLRFSLDLMLYTFVLLKSSLWCLWLIDLQFSLELCE